METASAQRELQQMIDSYQRGSLILAAVRLDLPRHLTELKSPAELGRSLNLDERGLRRLCNALTAIGLCRQVEDSYCLTALGAGLLDEKTRQRALLLDQYVDAWLATDQSLRGQRPAFEILRGESVWSFRKRNPFSGEAFAKWMKEDTRLHAEAIVRHFSFVDGAKILEVGSGHGGLREATLAAFPFVTYDLFDDCEAPEDLALIAGDMFTAIPSGYDHYLLKSVLHDWPDEQALKVLQNLRLAMGKTSRALIIERKFSYDGGPLALLDLHMMNITGGEERTPEAYEALFKHAGLSLLRRDETQNHFLLMEVVRGD